MNRATNPILLLVPHEALGAVLLLFLTLGGLCMVVGARRASKGLIATAIAVPFITVIMEALFNELFSVLPPSLIKPVSWLILIVVYIVIFGALMSFLFGQRTWEAAKGQLLSDSIKGVLRIAVSWPLLVIWGILAAFLWLK